MAGRLYTTAYELVHCALALFTPGASFQEVGQALFARIPRAYVPLRYPYLAHGVGLTDEYPGIVGLDDQAGEAEDNMVFSVEAYVGQEGGRQGVKLEEQFLVTTEGPQVFSSAPYDERLLA